MDIDDVCRIVELPIPPEEWCVDYEKLKSFKRPQVNKRPDRIFYNSYYPPNIKEINKLYIPYFKNTISILYYCFLPNGTGFDRWHSDFHVNNTKMKRYNFMWCAGGDNVITSWADNELVATDPNAPGINIVRTEIQTNRWYELDVTTYHSVNNISTPRIGLSIVGNIIDKSR